MAGGGDDLIGNGGGTVRSGAKSTDDSTFKDRRRDKSDLTVKMMIALHLKHPLQLLPVDGLSSSLLQHLQQLLVGTRQMPWLVKDRFHVSYLEFAREQGEGQANATLPSLQVETIYRL